VDLVYVAGLFGLIGLVLWASTRQNEIFRIAITKGKVRVVRGRVPPSFLGDLRDIVGHVQEGTIHAVKQGGEGRLVVSSSIDERTAQRLRNAYAIYPGKRL
jgi:Protein of unknown function (DUF3634)